MHGCLRKEKLLKKILVALILVIIIYVNLKLNLYRRSLETREKISDKPNVKIFNLKNPLKPKNIYSSIKCKLSASFYDVSTTICVHDLDKDKYVSKALWNDGFWELPLLSNLFFNYYLIGFIFEA